MSNNNNPPNVPLPGGANSPQNPGSLETLPATKAAGPARGMEEAGLMPYMLLDEAEFG